MASRWPSLLAFAVAVLVHVAVVGWWWSVSDQTVDDRLQEVTPPLRLLMRSMPLVAVNDGASASVSVAPVAPKLMSAPIQAVKPIVPAAPRKQLSTKSAHKASATQPKPRASMASSAGDQASSLPIADSTVGAALATAQSLPSASLEASDNRPSISALKDMAQAYRMMVLARLTALQAYPALAKSLGEEGTVLVRFTIAASGEIQPVNIVESSGSDSLDMAAMAIFSEGLAYRLPPIPAALQKSSWTLSVPIRYQLTNE